MVSSQYWDFNVYDRSHARASTLVFARAVFLPPLHQP